jgi:predicted transposase YbfD/YdcC
MKTLEDISLLEHFSDIEDLRTEQGKRHNLQVVMIMAICAILCNANSFGGIARFAKAKLDWFKNFFDLPHGSPSKDTFIRVFALIKVQEFESCFMKWVASIKENWQGETIAIDGKTLRGSRDKKNNLGALHLVQAYAVKAGLVLTQKKVDNKTNEITVIPELLESLVLKGTVVTIDAMGCQKKIAKKIREEKADYVLALKGNQGDFHKEVELFLNKLITKEIQREFDYDKEIKLNSHGREEIRECYAVEITKMDFKEKLFSDISLWQDLKTIAAVKATRIVKATGEASIETRFYISSMPPSAKNILERVKEHWGIENSLHYVLDVIFKEDASRVRKKSATENFALARKITLNLIKQNPRKGRNYNIIGKREMAGWSNDFLEELLFTN